MTFMQRFSAFVVLIGLTVSIGVSALPVRAQTLQDALGKSLDKAAPKELQGSKDLTSVVSRLISYSLSLVGVILFGYLLYAGFLWMTAGGDEKKVGTARTMISQAVIGLVIIVSAYAIATFVIGGLATISGAPQAI